MPTASLSLVGYTLDGINKVEGWLHDGAVTSTILLSRAQRLHGVEGDVGEIGIHHGKFFILLCHTLRPGEAGVAIDVFEDQHLNVDSSGRGDRAMFESNLAQHLGGSERIRILKADSMTLTPHALVRPSGGKFRIFSIDGGHTVAHVVNDLRLVEPLLHARGIVIVDDFFNVEWPGVTEGMFRYWREGGNLVPFVYGDGKLFLCRRAEQPSFYDVAERMLHPLSVRGKHVTIGELKCFWLTMPSATVALMPDGKMLTSFWNFANDGNGIKLLGAGWSAPDEYGVWTIGRHAELAMPVAGGPNGAGVPARISMSGYPFLPPNKGRQGLAISLNGRNLMHTEFSVDTLSHVRFDVPRSALLAGDNRLALTLDYPASPAQFGLSGDARMLAFHLSGLSLFEAT